MKRLGYRWREGELAQAIRYWTAPLLVYAAVLFSLVLVAYRWPW